MSTDTLLKCTECGSDLAESDLVCPSCRRLVHSDELKTLAAQAEERTNTGNLAAARDAWKRALELLPAETVQYSAVKERLAQIELRIAETAAEHRSPSRWKSAAIIGPALVFLITKGKFLLLGLANLTTLASMLAYAGVLWSLFGWKFGVGLIVSIYIHEMGHVASIRHFGMTASAPMFIPGFGAFVRLQQRWLNAAQDARIGLAGPRWGLVAAVVAWLIGTFTKQSIWIAIASGGAWLNLLNLLPVWNLDGGRAFRALNRSQRLKAAGVVFVMWLITREQLLIALAFVSVFRGFAKDSPAESDSGVLIEFAVLVVLLAFLSLPVPGAEPFKTLQ